MRHFTPHLASSRRAASPEADGPRANVARLSPAERMAAGVAPPGPIEVVLARLRPVEHARGVREDDRLQPQLGG